MNDLAHVFPSDCYALEAARIIAARLKMLAEARSGHVYLALSGGRTPLPVFSHLANAPLRDIVPWARLEIFWCDERCVPPHHPDSNFGAAQGALLAHMPLRPAQLHRITGELEPVAAARFYERELRARCRGRLDLALLGMGADGHTASLFPGGPELEVTTRSVVASRTPDGQRRVTMTLPCLAEANERWVLTTGADRREIVARARSGPGPLPLQRLSALAPLLWILDAAAAG